MTKQEYFEFHSHFCNRMIDVTKRKNSDYTGESGDPFANFRKIGDIIEVQGVTKEQIVLIGFLTRMSDKISRLGSFVAKGSFQVSDESFLDTAMDLANYCALLSGFQVSTTTGVKENDHCN